MAEILRQWHRAFRAAIRGESLAPQLQAADEAYPDELAFAVDHRQAGRRVHLATFR